MNRNTNFIQFAQPSIEREEEEAVCKVLRSGWLTTGKEVFAFEKEFSYFVGVTYALAVNSATAGLHLALDAIGTKKDDLVITTPYTFAATAEILQYFGAHPVFVDIEEETLNIDMRKIEHFLATKRGIKAIIPVHIAGYPCDMQNLDHIKKKYGIKIIEDAAHAFPVPTEQGFLGTLGDIGVYSFYANKTITTGEGGMVVSDSSEYAERIKIMRLHGIDRDIWTRYTDTNPHSWEYSVVDAGFKYNMPDTAAAIGRIQLKKAYQFYEKRKAIAEQYRNILKDKEYIILPPFSSKHAWHLFIIQIKENTLSISRDEFIKELHNHGIGVSVHYTPLHIMPYYRNKYGYNPDDFPCALRCSERAISLPIYPNLDREKARYIAHTIINVAEKHYKSALS